MLDIQLLRRDLSGVLTRGAASPHDELILFNNEKVAAIRTDRWKYVARSYYRTLNADLSLVNTEHLFDVRQDPSETYSLASLHPDVLADMKARFARAQAKFAPMATRK